MSLAIDKDICIGLQCSSDGIRFTERELKKSENELEKLKEGYDYVSRQKPMLVLTFRSLSAEHERVVQYFKEYIDQTFVCTKLEIDALRNRFEEELSQHVKAVAAQQDKDYEMLKVEVDALKNTRISHAEVEAMIRDTLQKFKAEMLEQYQERFEKLTLQNKQAFLELRQHYQNLLRKLQDEQNSEKMKEAVIEALDKRISTELTEIVRNEINRFAGDDGDGTGPKSLEERVISIMRCEAERLFDSRTTFQRLLELPELRVIQARLKNLEELFETERSTMQQRIQQPFQQQLAQIEEIRNSLLARSRNVGSANEVDINKVAKLDERIDKMNHELSIFKNRMQQIQNRFDFKVSEVERKLDESNSRVVNNDDAEIGRKRPRVIPRESNVGTANNDELFDISDYDKRLRSIETKCQHLTDFIYQFRTTLLHPAFPSRLQMSIYDLEKIVRNHEEVISFLVDPTAATSRTLSKVPVAERSGGMSAAMCVAIEELMQKRIEEATAPLLKKISELESKSSNNQS